MSTNEFDRLIRDKFDNGEFAYKQEGWEQLSRRMDITPAGAKAAPAGLIRWLPKAGIAAGVALLTGLFLYYFSSQHTGAEKPGSIASGNQPVINTNTQPSVITRPPATTTTTTGEEPATAIQPVYTAATHNTAPGNSKTQQAPAIQKNDNTIVPQAGTAEETTVAQANNNTPATKTQQTENKQPVARLPRQPDFAENAYMPDDHTHKGGKTSFSLAGGVNYGSLNTGYTVGVSARRKLGGGHFYLEGDVAFVNSNAPKAASVSDAQFDALNNNYSGAFNSATAGNSGEPSSLASVSAPVKNVSQEQALNSLYYLQFSPSVGYNVRKNISVSVGADVQRLLQNNSSDETPVVLESSELKLIPQTDIGLTGKAEYGVTRRLKAGMLYREGVNALIDNKYINRRYVQVQLKFMLFGK